ncbi:odorant receptor Or2-like [Ptiloglossa arizonensis]|uniref:odorant receptor Or2-like n=1 Tax=Ptiloglossa arizonensis TaxID=3350558 RepID=UPI003FA0BC2F
MYLSLVGQYPQQTNYTRIIIFTVLLVSLGSLLLVTVSQIIVKIRERNTDGVLECIPILITNLVTMIKIVNLNINRELFKKLYDLVIEEWITLVVNDDVRTLNKVTKQGSKIAYLYRSCLLTSLLFFALLPLMSPFLDIVLPLNETRLRQQIFKLNYLVDGDEYFYYIYFHLVWSSTVIVVIIVSVDSSYMLITHHVCGLFAVCGNQINRIMENINTNTNNIAEQGDLYRRFRNCIIIHEKALMFYELVEKMNRNSFLLQIGLSFMSISVTAVQAVMNLDQPREALRIGLFFGAQKFHLFFISLPGQKLVDHSLELSDNVCGSKWYQTPVKMQKMLHMIQIRSSVPCTLSAGGLYDMNIENFGMIFKSCMSYFTMLMSMRES